MEEARQYSVVSEYPQKSNWLLSVLVTGVLASFPILIWCKALDMKATGEAITRFGSPLPPGFLWLFAASLLGTGCWAISKVIRNEKVENWKASLALCLAFAMFFFGASAAAVLIAKTQTEIIEG